MLVSIFPVAVVLAIVRSAVVQRVVQDLANRVLGQIDLVRLVSSWSQRELEAGSCVRSPSEGRKQRESV